MTIETYEKARKLIWEIEKHEKMLRCLEAPGRELFVTIGDWCFNLEEQEVQIIKNRIKKNLKQMKDELEKL